MIDLIMKDNIQEVKKPIKTLHDAFKQNRKMLKRLPSCFDVQAFSKIQLDEDIHSFIEKKNTNEKILKTIIAAKFQNKALTKDE